jgi:hypothetical protein
LTDFISYILCKLDPNHRLDLLNRDIRLNIYIPDEHFLDLFLAGSSSSFGLGIPCTNMPRNYFVNNNLISIILTGIGDNNLRVCPISTLVACFFSIFIRGLEKEFVLDKSVLDNL